MEYSPAKCKPGPELQRELDNYERFLALEKQFAGLDEIQRLKAAVAVVAMFAWPAKPARILVRVTTEPSGARVTISDSTEAQTTPFELVLSATMVGT